MQVSLYQVVFAENAETAKRKSDNKINKQINKHRQNRRKKGWQMLLFKLVNCQICDIGLVYKSISSKMAYASVFTCDSAETKEINKIYLIVI